MLKQWRKTMAEWLGVIITVIGVCFFLFIVFSYEESSTPSSSIVTVSTTEPGYGTIEYKCACIDAGYHVKENDIRVGRFRILLEDLSKKCPENKKKIADLTSGCQDQFKKLGYKFTLLEIMESLNKTIPSENTLLYEIHVQSIITAALIM